MDRATKLFIAGAITERTRDYTKDALNELLRAMDGIEHQHGLVETLTDAEEAAVSEAEVRLARGEQLPELELNGPIEDFLPEPFTSILERLHALPMTEQDAIYGMIALLIDIGAKRLRLSPAQVAEIRLRTK